ncbi:FAD/NAD(P)-binding domain-containing protein [Suhomyces tanzawaensis NRRL Y-17324]|uniref:FAD/NAD(P)-binding domain-containing protein n=1 Tax=Suhomyces tanzawaensis NRRL Y-17324 TaxID=984487 RepID=A0A1E4SDM8_9ASCO|nr:FAD/NAD(P)-binding domain-containing protein [Suhomyces tanzawaensis NRRL Y-17324]ODV77620.1 FAD/NAD(P)-binding domain-containing protein [Suhomyces tanzawaensis NRRL Y-17324]
MTRQYSRIAIIGGGCSGLAAAKALALEPHQFTIDLFERRNQLGGIWNYDVDKARFRPSVPSTHNGARESVGPGGLGNQFLSPMYSQLETNLLKDVMEFKDVKFPSTAPDFPSRNEVLDYVVQYSKTIPSGVNFHFLANVISLTNNADWELVVQGTHGTVASTLHYDAVVVANGHFDIPYIPDVPGLKEWDELRPNSISHAKYFDDGSKFVGEKVLVVGNYASGSDISTQLSVYAEKVYVSTRDPENTTRIPHQQVEHIGLVTNYRASTRLITTEDLTIDNIDHIIFCTGYLYDIPFLKSYPDVITDGLQVHNLYKQIFYINDPSLAFVALNKFIAPMPFAESQAALIARVFSGRYSLPSQKEMDQEYSAELQAKGSGKAFHNLKFPEDVEYCNHILSLLKIQGVEDGFVGYFWDEHKKQERSTRNKELKNARTLKLVELANQRRKLLKIAQQTN